MKTTTKYTVLLSLLMMAFSMPSYAKLSCSYKFPVGIKCKFVDRKPDIKDFELRMGNPSVSDEIEFNSIQEIQSSRILAPADKAQAIQFFKKRAVEKRSNLSR